MSVLKKLLGKKKSPDSEQSVGLSLAMPDDLSALPRGPGADKAGDTQLQDLPAPPQADQEEIVSVPLLGRRRLPNSSACSGGCWVLR
jgi:twitching motility protein PilJ